MGIDSHDIYPRPSRLCVGVCVCVSNPFNYFFLDTETQLLNATSNR